jgi:4-hydroxy-tetrahydrodipicolinate synthase
MFNGSMVALVTPMQPDGSIDKKALHDLVEWHIAAKTDALVITGTTGEGSTLSTAEQFDLISCVVSQTENRIPIIAGTGSNSTQHTIELTENARKARANAALIVTPYYNKPTQAGLYEHYKTVAEKVTLPILLYNVPSRTGCDILPETVESLAKINTIVGIKEATGKVDRTIEIIQRCGKEFIVYSGDDLTAYELMLNGAKGVISVTANIAPEKMVEFCQAALSGNKTLANKLNTELTPLHQAMFLETNPIPAKWALYEMGLIPSGIRLPLLPLDSKYRDEIKTVLHEMGLLREKTFI